MDCRRTNAHAFYDKIDWLTKEYIDERYICDHENKCFRHKKSISGAVRAGTLLGSIPPTGSRLRETHIKGDRVTIRALYTFYKTGVWPIDKMEL